VKKVLMLTQFLGIGGLERMILNLSMSLKAHTDWHPEVYAFDQSYHDTHDVYMDDTFRELGIPVSGNRKKDRFSWTVVRQIVKHVEDNQIQVIHTHDLGALIYGALTKIRLLGRVKVIHTQHSFVHLSRHFRYRLYERFFTLFADKITVVSKDTQDSYIELGVNASKIKVIPNGVEFAVAPVLDPSEKRRLREVVLAESTEASKLMFSVDSHWILYLARVHAGKGQILALDVWNALPEEKRLSSVLIFVGPETFEGELSRLKSGIEKSKNPERVIYAGPSQHPARWIRASDVFVSSSEFEGMPLAPNEAAGSGLPVLLSDIPGHECLNDMGYLYPLADPGVGAEKLSDILAQLDSDYSGALKKYWEKGQRIRQTLSTRAMALEYQKNYLD